jgi:hypothetical protein
MVALDEPSDLGHLAGADVPVRAANEVEQLAGGGEDLRPEAVGAADDLRPGMVEQDDRTPRHRLPALGYETLQLLERLRQLQLRRAPAPVSQHRHVADLVAVAVGPAVHPLLRGDAERPVDVLDLDREQPRGADQQVVDLPAAVAVALEQRPGVIEGAVKGGVHLPFSLGSGLERRLVARRSAVGRRRGRAGPFAAPDGHPPAQRRQQPPARHRRVTPLTGLGDGPVVGRERQPISFLVPLPGAGSATACLSQHLPGVIGKRDKSHTTSIRGLAPKVTDHPPLNLDRA